MSDRAKLRDFHSARWDEPLLVDISQPGRRGIIPPRAEPEIDAAVGDVETLLPQGMVRRSPLPLPELSQPEVVRHFSRLSQMTMGNDVGNDIGQGTCTCKYSPKVNEVLARSAQMTDIHPLQDERTAQGILEILYRARDFMREISAMDEVSFQAGAGGQGVLTAACMLRAYHKAHGQDEQRDQIITTIHSHPVDAACPATVGYEVITLWPDEQGYPDLAALKSAVSERTAGVFMTNPEDHRALQPSHRRIREGSPQRRGPLLHGSGQLERDHQQGACARRRLRHVPLQPAQDLLKSPRHIRPRLCRCLRDRRAGAFPAGTAYHKSRGRVPPRFRPPRHVSVASRTSSGTRWSC